MHASCPRFQRSICELSPCVRCFRMFSMRNGQFVCVKGFSFVCRISRSLQGLMLYSIFVRAYMTSVQGCVRGIECLVSHCTGGRLGSNKSSLSPAAPNALCLAATHVLLSLFVVPTNSRGTGWMLGRHWFVQGTGSVKLEVSPDAEEGLDGQVYVTQ